MATQKANKGKKRGNMLAVLFTVEDHPNHVHTAHGCWCFDYDPAKKTLHLFLAHTDKELSKIAIVHNVTAITGASNDSLPFRYTPVGTRALMS